MLTILPYGAYGVPPQEPVPLNEWDGPGLLQAYFRSEYGTSQDANIPLGCTRQPGGAYRSVVPLKRLPSSVTPEDVFLFDHQIRSLSDAIKLGYLKKADVQTRLLACEAMRRQHDCFGKAIAPDASDPASFRYHKPTFEECAKNKDRPCGIILVWANQEK